MASCDTVAFLSIPDIFDIDVADHEKIQKVADFGLIGPYLPGRPLRYSDAEREVTEGRSSHPDGTDDGARRSPPDCAAADALERSDAKPTLSSANQLTAWASFHLCAYTVLKSTGQLSGVHLIM
ncbi:hypothetical protein HDZ31DRAFT_66537 [Schizophyllum fasciatum]